MADTEAPTAPDRPLTEVLEEKNKKIAELEEQVRKKDQLLAVYADTVGKLRDILLGQAKENFNRVQEILEIAGMRAAKATGPKEAQE